MSELTDAEREALICDCHGPNNMDCCPFHAPLGDSWIDKPAVEVVAVVESIVAARLSEQRETLATAIETRVADLERIGKPRAGFIDAYTIAARIVREYQPGERCTCVGMDEKPGCDHQ